jgi:NagD protein
MGKGPKYIFDDAQPAGGLILICPFPALQNRSMPLLSNEIATRLRNATLFLLDLDGTMYRGRALIPGAATFIERLRKRKVGYVFLTNNSSRSAEEYRCALANRGIPANPENVFTSSQATGLYLSQRKPHARVFVAGTGALCRELASYGLRIMNSRSGAVSGSDPDNGPVDFVVAGFDTELTYEKILIACSYVNQGVEYIATNPDYACPVEDGKFIPDCGSICFMIEQATGKKPYIVGKPNPAMVLAVCDRLKTPVHETVIIGDRLYTDIAAGRAAGALTICVLTGESTRADIERSPFKPDAIIESIDSIIHFFSDTLSL